MKNLVKLFKTSILLPETPYLGDRERTRAQHTTLNPPPTQPFNVACAAPGSTVREGLDLPLSVIWSIAVQVALLGMAEPAGGAAPPVRFVHPASHVHRFISILI